MSAVGELKTVISIRDNMSAGLKAIQKEQLRIKKEIQETKEILKDIFGKKWTIKLQSAELLQHIRNMGKEMGMLRKQLVEILNNIGRETPVQGVSVVLKSAAEKTQNSTVTPAVEKTLEYIPVLAADFGKSNDKVSGKTSNRTEAISSFAGDAASTIVETGIEALGTLIGGAIGTAIAPVGGTAVGAVAGKALGKVAGKFLVKAGSKIFANGVGKVVEGVTKENLEYREQLREYGSVMEQQSQYMETILKDINPEMAAKDVKYVKSKRDDFIKLLRDNSAETGFDQNDVIIAGATAAKITGGNIEKAMGYVKLVEDMAARNPGVTATKAMEALYNAKNGNMEGIKGFLPGVNLQDFKPEEFEEKVMPKLMEQYKGGVEEWLKTTAGLAARKEMTELRDMQNEAFKANERNKLQYENDYKKRNMTTEERIDILGGGFTGIGSIKYSINQTQDKAIKFHEQTDTRNNISNRNEIPGVTREPEWNRMYGMHISPVMTPQNNAQSNNTTIKNPQFIFNLNGANMSAQDIASKLVPQVKMLIANMGSQPNRNVRLGGALA